MTMTKSGSRHNHLESSSSSNKQTMGGCMSGFFNFSHILSGKRCHHKRLPAPPPPSVSGNNLTSEPVPLVGSPALISKQPGKFHLQHSPHPELRPPAPDPVPKSPLQGVSTFEFKEAVKSPWKFAREAPRLSLDSRAVVDAKGGLRPREIRINAAANSAGCGGDVEISENQRRSPCVIARLMGLEQPPGSVAAEKAELRRSASESRSRDYRFLETPSFLSPLVASRNELDQSANGNYNVNHNLVKSKNQSQNQNGIQINQRRSMAERKKYYNTADFFPPEIHAKQHQQQHQALTIYGEIERRLRMRGIDEPSKDLETLKYILEALQLKGLLHSSAAAATAATTAAPRRNLVSDRDSPSRRRNTTSSGEPSVSLRRERISSARAPSRSDYRSSSPPVRRKGGPLSLETTPRRSSQSPVQSPKTMKRCDHHNQTMNRSPRGRRSTVEMNHRGERFSRHGPAEDDASTVSESSFSTSSHTETERWRREEYKEGGRSLLERCDKLLHSIAEMNSNPNPNPNLYSNSNPNTAELQQPSPVSVLDSSFYKEDDSPSPVKKRSIHCKDQILPEFEDELWSPSSLSSSSSSRTQLLSNPDHHHHHHHHHHLGIDSSSSEDPDFIYVSEVYRASYYLPSEPDLFSLLEKQISIRGNKEETSKVSFLQRKLIFDTLIEILDWAHRLPPWKSSPGKPSLQRVWAEFRRIREGGPAQDLFEVIIAVLKKDLAKDSITGWGECPVEMSEVVLDIERLIFKDLIGESIQDLAAVAGKNVGARKHCRKLLF
ncbi:hypothetical protein Cgig2_021515 [Carnegiea gigantea]|uniref:DUF4378 domain-containing protein n=1 Tax=Carnegiea gigantea TaxID=171969 RepID=A0A9Q1QIU1_9CARY|nr:hypothetical protein Cgig2_021515 [Carnegiea gigantea]